MTPEQIIKMAKQSGFGISQYTHMTFDCVNVDELQAFAQLVRNAALEDAAKVVDKLADGDDADTAQQFALDIASDKIRSMKK